MSLNEYVMVVDAQVLRNIFNLSRGLNPAKSDIFDFILNNHCFISRADAERDPNYKQIIPYVTIRRDGLWLLFQRKSTQTEARLHNKYSLGLGGHITRETDHESLNPIMAGLYRELDEEISIKHGEPKYIGILNDDESDVGKVHLGLLFEINAQSSIFELPEADKMSAQWVETDALAKYYPQMETWSQFLLDLLRNGTIPNM